MTDEHMDDTFRELQAELTVTPSPEFAAKVRAQIADAPARSWLAGWRLAGASAAMLAGAVAVVLWRGGAATPNTAPHSAVAGVGGVASVANLETPPRPAVAGRVAAPAVSPARARDPRPAGHGVTAARGVAPFEPEVLVEPGQAMAISRYMAGLRSGPLAGAAGAAPIEGTAGEIVTPKLIEIPLIVVDLLPGTPDGRGGGRKNP